MGRFNYSIHLEGDDWSDIWLIARAEVSDLEYAHPIQTTTFSVEELQEVLLATPWIQGEEGRLYLKNDVWHEHLAEVVNEMLGYFHAPDEPYPKLLEVKAAVGEYHSIRESSIDFSLYTYAWLDVMVREDVADEARSKDDIWRHDQMSVDCESICDRRVEELIAYYSRSQMRIVGRMAGSISTHETEKSRNTETG